MFTKSCGSSLFQDNEKWQEKRAFDTIWERTRIASGSVGRMYSDTVGVSETRALRAEGVGLSLDPEGKENSSWSNSPAELVLTTREAVAQ